MTYEEITKSRALELISRISVELSVDVNDPEQLIPALLACVLRLIDAIDSNRIAFSTEIDEAALIALMMLSLDQSVGGKLRDALIETAVIH